MGKKSRKKQNKNIKVKPDEVYVSGHITQTRYGEAVIIENNISKEEHEIHKKLLADNYPIICEKIKVQINKIKELVKKFHPLQLLHRGYFAYVNIAYDKTSPSQIPEELTTICRMVDYIQSLIASNDEIKCDSTYMDWSDEDEKKWNLLYQEVDELFKLLNFEYHLSHSYFLEQNTPNYQYNEDKYYVFAQMYWTTVRGNRYYCFEIENLKDLLLPHSSVFEELFNITALEFINGIEKMGESLTLGWGQALSEYNNLKGDEPEDYLNDLYGRLHGLNLFNVGKVTNLSQKLLDCLSFEIGQDKEFATGEYAYSPLNIWSTAKRPFLKVNNEYFCFDQLILFDNLYRIIQRAIFKLKPEYRQKWNNIQQKQTEDIACSLFEKLLPKSKIHRNVYSKFQLQNKNKQDWRENDAIIIDDDNLIILEVKGGAFTYTPPAYDFEAFKNSIKSLMEKPAIQGQYLIDELNKQKILILYNQKHQEIDKINISNFRNIIICCCTLDNFTAFSTKQNILNDLGLEKPKYPSWTLSIDDLRIYADLIESPSQFVHFLEQRLKAINSRLSFNDEIDHLALYFKCNCYVDAFRDVTINRITIGSHKEEIDTYYHNKYVLDDRDELIKPHQKISKRIKEIIHILDKQHKTGYTKIAGYLLDLGPERENFEYLLEKALSRQKEISNLMPLHLPYKTAVSFILYQDSIYYENLEDMPNQIYANMIITNVEECDCIELYYDRNNILYNIDFYHYKLAALDVNGRKAAEKYAEWLKANRLKMYIKNNSISKIGRNDQCPCGSGKKYKLCCGR